MLEICVSDEGPGFSPQALCHALEPMYTEGKAALRMDIWGLALPSPGKSPDFIMGKYRLKIHRKVMEK